MAGERTKLTVKTREHLGSRETRRLRRQGIVPGVLYGFGDPVSIAVEERELRRALTGAAGLHSILDVEIVVATVTAPTREAEPEEVEVEEGEAAEGGTPEGEAAEGAAEEAGGTDAAGDQGTAEG